MKKLCYFVFAAYIAVMLYLLYGQRVGLDIAGSYFERLSQNYNLIPFKTVSEYIEMALTSPNIHLREHAFINLLGNIFMFIPLGFLLPCIFSVARKFGKHILICTVIIFVIEIIQLFSLLGSCDIDDLILNICGTSSGFAVFILIKHLTKRI